MRRAIGTLLLGLLLLPSHAAADAGAGGFIVQGVLHLPTGSQLTTEPRIAFLEDSSDMHSLEMRIPQVTYHYNELTYRVAAIPGQSPMYVYDDTVKRSGTMHNATIRLGPGPSDGFVGFYAVGGARLELRASGEAMVVSRGKTVASSTSLEHADHGVAGPDYQQEQDGPHAAIEAVGLLRQTGPGIIKLAGPDIVIESAEGARAFRTGSDAPVEGPLSEAKLRWVVLQFSYGIVEMDAPHPWVVTGGRVSAEWDGRAAFFAQDGAWESGRGTYEAEGGTVTLDGVLRATYAPQPGNMAYLRVAGDLRVAPLGLAVVQTPGATIPGVPWGPLVVFGAALAGGALLATTSRRRGGVASRGVAFLAAPPPQTPVDECRRQAARCIDEDRWVDAALWLQRAHDMAPDDERLRADLAYALLQVGRPEEALHLLEEARGRLALGESKLHAAHAALLAGRPHEEVAAWLVEAWEAEPGLVTSLDPFDALVDDEGVARAIERARKRLHGPG